VARGAAREIDGSRPRPNRRGAPWGRSTIRAVLGLAAVVAAAAGLAPATVAAAATSVSNVSVVISSPSSAAQAKTVYTIGFTTSATGALSAAAGSTITVDFPRGTDVTALGGTSGVYVGSTNVAACYDESTVGPPVTPIVRCHLAGTNSVPANTAVTVGIGGVLNAAAGSQTLLVDTTSDTTFVAKKYTVTAARSMSGLTSSLSSTVPSATGVTDTIGFTTSTTGALAYAADSSVKTVFPTGTNVNSLGAATGLFVGPTRVGTCSNASTSSPPVVAVRCQLYSGHTVPASTAATAVFAGLTNPGPGSYHLSVSSTSDVTAMTSSFTIGSGPLPTIKKVTPAKGAVGKKVTITGANLSGATKVTFNGVAATITSDTVKKLVTTVPAGATSGSVSVVTPSGTAMSAKSFTVT
jgi:hypothetical protein